MSPLPSRREVGLAVYSLPPRQRGWLLVCGAIFFVTLIALLWNANQALTVEVPAYGGTLVEGIIGSPRFINPLLATSDADRDLSALIYSGLLRVSSNSELKPDLAESYTVSPDGLTYNFTLRPNLTWHDGTPLTSADVEFTVHKAQDPLIKSPKRAAWEGVRVEVPDERHLTFTLKQAYPLFLEAATMGIVPKHIWNNFDADAFALNQFNTEGVGSGPYKVEKIKKDSLGVPEYYELEAFNHFALGQPKLATVRLAFYPNETALLEAYRRGEVASLGGTSAEAGAGLEAEGARLLKQPLPRVFGVFFNQNRAPVLANKEVRQALNLALDKQNIIDTVLKGYGLPAQGPLPEMILTQEATTLIATSTATSTPSKIEQAAALLTKNGWQQNNTTKVWEKKTKKETQTLAFSLSTSDTPELKQAAEMVAKAWGELGAQVDLKIFEIGDLNQDVIRPRQYDALFFGEVLGRTPDPFAFWHSSQRLDPGLNIALYTNVTADNLLEKAHTLTDKTALANTYTKFEAEVARDAPAIFIYSPYFLYVVPADLQNVHLPIINTPADRFLTINEWYLETERVWKIFKK